MTPMLYVSLLLNVAVLIPVCLGLARGARWADEAWGSPGPARGILLSIYAAILILSVLLLLLGQPLPAAPLLAVQILYKLMAPFIVRKPAETPPPTEAAQTPEIPRLRAKSYMDSFINPPEYLEAQRRKLERDRDKPRRNPAEPERDVLLFLLRNAPLEAWELARY